MSTLSYTYNLTNGTTAAASWTASGAKGADFNIYYEAYQP